MSRVAFRVVGRVQGVGFRNYCRVSAEDCGCVGWVRNEADGSVVGEAGGSSEALAAFRAALESGPVWSRVDSVELRELDCEGITDVFEVRR